VPYWSPTLVKLTKFRTHIFYRWPGFWGTRPAFRQGVRPAEPIIPALAALEPAHRTTDLAVAPVVLESGAAAPAELVPAPVVLVPGASARSMRGSVVRREPEPNVFFAELEDRDFPGNFAITALAVCKNKPVCRFYGWTDRNQVGQQMPLTRPQQDALLFYYERGADGADKALWNCRQVARKNAAQCMSNSRPVDAKPEPHHQ
jgi:hypothetical protein